MLAPQCGFLFYKLFESKDRFWSHSIYWNILIQNLDINVLICFKFWNMIVFSKQQLSGYTHAV